MTAAGLATVDGGRSGNGGRRQVAAGLATTVVTVGCEEGNRSRSGDGGARKGDGGTGRGDGGRSKLLAARDTIIGENSGG